MTWNLQIALALLLGSDYSQGVYGIGPESASQIVRSIGDKCVLQKFASEGIEGLKTLKGAKKLGQVFKNSNKENMLDHDMALNHGGENNSQKRL